MISNRNHKSATIRRLLQENTTHRRKHPSRERSRHARDAVIALSPSPIYSPSPSPLFSPSISPRAPSLSPIGPPSPAPSPAPSQSSHKLANNFNSESVPAKATEKHKKTDWVIYVSVGAGVLLVASAFAMYFLCGRTNKVGVVMPWKTGLSGQLQKALVTGWF